MAVTGLQQFMGWDCERKEGREFPPVKQLMSLKIHEHLHFLSAATVLLHKIKGNCFSNKVLSLKVLTIQTYSSSQIFLRTGSTVITLWMKPRCQSDSTSSSCTCIWMHLAFASCLQCGVLVVKWFSIKSICIFLYARQIKFGKISAIKSLLCVSLASISFCGRKAHYSAFDIKTS